MSLQTQAECSPVIHLILASIQSEGQSNAFNPASTKAALELKVEPLELK